MGNSWDVECEVHGGILWVTQYAGVIPLANEKGPWRTITGSRSACGHRVELNPKIVRTDSLVKIPF